MQQHDHDDGNEARREGSSDFAPPKKIVWINEFQPKLEVRKKPETSLFYTISMAVVGVAAVVSFFAGAFPATVVLVLIMILSNLMKK